jgi:hypothetical protein
MSNPDDELNKLDIAAAIERSLWDAYYDGGKQAKRLGGSNRVVLEQKKFLLRLLKAHDRTILDRVEKEIIGEDETLIEHPVEGKHLEKDGKTYVFVYGVQKQAFRNELRAEQRQALARWGEKRKDNNE